MKSNKLYRIFALMLVVVLLVNMFAGSTMATEDSDSQTETGLPETSTEETNKEIGEDSNEGLQQENANTVTELKAWLTAEEIKVETENSDTDGETNSDTDGETNSDTDDETNSDTDGETNSDTDDETNSDTDDESNSDTDGETNSDTDDETNSDADGETNSDTDGETNSDTDDETNSDTDDETNSDTDGETNSDTDDETNSDADDETNSDTDDETNNDTDDETKSDADDETNSDTDDETNNDTDDETNSDTDGETNSDTDGETGSDTQISIKKSQYTLHVSVGGEEISFDEADEKLQSVEWKLSNAGVIPAEKTICATFETELNAAVEVTVTYDGFVLALTSEKNLIVDAASSEELKEKALTLKFATDVSVDGIIFNTQMGSANLSMPELNQACTLANGAQKSVDTSDLDLNGLELTLNKTASKEEQTITVSAIGTSGTVYAQTSTTLLLVEPNLEFAVETGEFLRDGSKVTFTVIENAEGHLKGFNHIPTISFQGREAKIDSIEFNECVLENKNAKQAVWTVDSMVDGTYTIQFGSESVEVEVDTVEPEITLTVKGKVFENGNRSYVMPENAAVNDDAEDAETIELEITISITDDNYSGEAETSMSVECAAGAVTEIEIQDILEELKIEDDAGNPAKEIILQEEVSATESNVRGIQKLPLNGVFYVDRQSPSITFPDLIVTRIGEEDKNAKTIKYNLSINDGDNGSGIESICYSVEDDMEALKPVTEAEPSKSEDDSNYVVEIETINNAETNVGKLYITAVDNAGNTRTVQYTENICVDHKAPEITVTMPPQTQTDGVDYYDDAQTVNLEITELNFDSEKVRVTVSLMDTNGKTETITVGDKDFIKWNEVEIWTPSTEKVNTHNASFTIGDTAGCIIKSVTVEATDAVGNGPAETEVTSSFVVDENPMEIEFELPNEAGETQYYSEEQTVYIKLYEDNFDNENTKVYYVLSDGTELDVDGTVVTKESVCAATWEKGEDEKGRYHATSFTVKDTAGRSVESVIVDLCLLAEENTVVTEECAFVVDKTDADIQITMPQDQKWVGSETNEEIRNDADNEFGSISYYKTEAQIVTMQITEDNFDENDVQVKVKLGEEEITIYGEANSEENIESQDDIDSEDKAILKWTQDWTQVKETPNEYIAEFEVYDTKGLTVDQVSVTVTDKAKREVNATVNDKDFVVDGTDPKVTIELNEAVIGFYTKVLADGTVDQDTVYLILDEPAILDTQINATNSLDETDEGANGEKTIELTVTIEDDNLTSESDGNINNYFVADLGELDINVEENTDKIVYKVTVLVKENEVKDIPLKLQVYDLAGRTPLACQVKPSNANENEITTSFEVVFDEGKCDKMLVVDNMTPTTEDESVPPEIKIELPKPVNTSTNDLPLYNGDFEVSFTIIDKNSGIRSFDWDINDGLEDREFIDASWLYENQTESTEQVSANILIATQEQKDATNSAVLTISATDNVGNKITATYAFAVDTLQPDVIIDLPHEQEGNKQPNIIDEIAYYSEAQTVYLTVKDINFDSTETTVTVLIGDTNITVSDDGAVAQWNEKWSDNTGDGNYTASFKINDTAGIAVESVTVTTTDKAGNKKEYPEACKCKFVVDAQAPEVEIILPQDQKEDKQPNTIDEIDYYKEEQTVIVRVSDNNFYPTYTTVSYSKNNEVIEDVLTAEAWEETGENVYKASFKIEDTAGLIINSVTVKTMDKANNYPMTNDGEELPNGVTEENPFVVDSIHPVVVIELPENPVNSYSNVDFYSTKQTIYIQITDDNFCADYTTVSYSKNNEAIEDVLTAEAWKEIEENVYEASFKIEDTAGLIINSVAVNTLDKANNYPMTNDGVELPNGVTEEVSFIVDEEVPDVDIQFSDNVVAFYYKTSENAEENANTVYLKLDPAVTVTDQNKSTQSVRVTVKIKDDNITENCGVANLCLGGIWKTTENKCAINSAEDIIEYQAEVEVGANKVVSIPLQLQVTDLANWNPNDVIATKAYTTTDSNGNKNTITTSYTMEFNEKGEANETIWVDRRQPTSNGEGIAPEIILTLPQNVGTASDNKTPLYNSNFDINFEVIDNNAGLQSVLWKIDDGLLDAEFFDTGAEFSYANGFTKVHDEITASVKLNGVNETNAAVLNITAIDNVGNKITYSYNFAVDNRAPRVTVVADNNSYLNERYFKENRLITVTVEDLNFDPQQVNISTEISGTPVAKGVYSFSYEADGEYSIIVTKIADLAGNTTSGRDNIDGYLNYNACAAYRDFVIDKTAPEISLTLTSDSAVHNEKYYNKDVLATATIREVNFREPEVDAKVERAFEGNTNVLDLFTEWSGTLDRVSEELLREDGDYSISISYTDLAGNPAELTVEAELTIDQTEPQVSFSEGLNLSANKGVVEPVVTFTDINLDVTGCRTTTTQTLVSGSDRIDLSFEENKIDESKITHNFDDIPTRRDCEGIYTMVATVRDLAGNENTDSVTFSVNRFGSTYMITDEATSSILKGYSKEAIAIEVIEINPDEVFNQIVSANINNGTSFESYVEGETLTIDKSEMSETWKTYTYTIPASAFMDGDALKEGKYELTFYSEDNAGNKNSNEANLSEDNNSCQISFTLDDTPPIVEILNLENDQVIEHESYDVLIRFSDGYALRKVVITLDGEEIVIEDTEDAKNLTNANGEWILTVPESDREHELSVYAVDAAGKEYTTETIRFFINSSWLQRYYHNKPLFFGSIGGGVILIALVVLFIKKPKNAKKAMVS